MSNIKQLLLRVCVFGLVILTSNLTMYAQLTINVKNKPLREVIKEIEKSSEYRFFYNEDLSGLNVKVSVNSKKNTITEILEQIVNQANVAYTVKSDKQVVLTEKVKLTTLQKKITGKITDSEGEPIIGANISIKGTSQGVITDLQGTFMLEVPESAILQISYIGFANKEVVVGDRKSIQVVLQEDSKILDEVVVVGYGTQKKVNLTGAVETVKAKDIASKPVTSAAQALTGEMAGVTVIQRSSKPGAYDENIRIRGVGTWGNSNPLILVDGVELGLDKVNPNDIENVSVLKDASAAAIYGSRAGNGVILITTKRGGKEGKPVINFSSNFGLQVITRIPDKQDALTFCQTEDQRLINDKKSPKHTDRIAKMQAGEWNMDHQLANTDWMDEVTHSAFQQNHNISVGGGGKYTSYLASLGYLSQESVVGNNTDFQRYNARLNTSSKITDWLNVDANMAYMTAEAKEPATGVVDVMKHALNIEPYLPVSFSDGTYLNSGIAQNPVRMGFTDDYGIGKSTVNNFSGLVSPEISLFGFKLKGLLAYERQIKKGDTFTKTVKYDAFTPVGASNPIQTEQTTVAENRKKDDWSALTNLTLNATLTYEKTIGAHDFKVLLGVSREELNSESTSSAMSGFPNNDLDEIGAGTTKPSISGGYSRTALSSYFGRLNYSFKDRYLLEMNVRRDGSSKFARGHRWGTFPSGSLGWRISEESFFVPVKDVVNNLKIRASYGQLGNNRIADYKYLSTIANSDHGYIFGNSTIETSYYENLMGNSIITWESLESTNFGVDMSLLNNRLTVSADYFIRNTKDILLELPAPGTLGIAPPTTNAAEVSNKGWELTLNWRDQIQDFKYNVSFNISDVRNEVTDLKGYKAPTNELTILREGEPINALFGWKSLGICRTQEDFEKYKKQMSGVSSKFAIGDLIYEDINHDGKVDGDDQTIIGNQIPRYTFGLRLGLEYKNFDFSCFFQGVGKSDGYLTYEAQMQLYNTSNSFDPKTNTDAKYPRIMPDSHYTYGRYSSFWVQDASYVRLKNIQLGYTFKMLEKYKISNLRMFFSGENIATFTKYQGFDPESPIGMRGWMYPLVGVYSFGFNLTF